MTVSVAIIAMAGQADLRACLDALRAQVGAPELEIVAVYEPHLPNMDAVGADYPEIRLLPNTGQQSPLELASIAIRETQGARVLVTKDYCRPTPQWAAQLLATLDEDCAAAGGPVRLPDTDGPVSWAFSYLDFFPYTGPNAHSDSATLTVCNAAYRRADLEALSLDWKSHFQETAVNEALKALRGRPLRLNAAAPVTMIRSMSLQAALQERYALGRVFAAKRLEYASPRQRWVYRLGAPALPPLMMSRMAHQALRDPQSRPVFFRSLAPLSAMVLARAAGEWLGYITGQPPGPS